MKKTLSTCEAAGYLLADGNANWTRSGAFALVEFLEQFEEDFDEIEMDVVALRCEYAQWRSLQEWAQDYTGTADFWDELGIDLGGEEDEDEKKEKLREYILGNGQLIEFEGGIIVSSF